MMNQTKILIFYLVFTSMLMALVSAAQIWEQPYDVENDPDIDHLTTSEELELGTDPNNRDTDGDGLTDGNEFLAKTNPLIKDTDDDGFDDKYEYDNRWHGFDPTSLSIDTDGDGLEDEFENMIGTYPKNPDSDGDGYGDKFEYDNSFYGWEPAEKNFDDDGDGLTNALESTIGTDPENKDTDGDSYSDEMEYDLRGEGLYRIIEDFRAREISQEAGEVRGIKGMVLIGLIVVLVRVGCIIELTDENKEGGCKR